MHHLYPQAAAAKQHQGQGHRATGKGKTGGEDKVGKGSRSLKYHGGRGFLERQ